jgi:hypothetical protein
VPIPFTHKLKRLRKEVRLKNNLVGNNSEWMVWWYCGIYKNHLSDSQPNVLTAFRELSSDSLSDNVILRRVPLTSLGQLRIGTVWKDGMCRSEAVFDTDKFDVDFTKGSWRFTSFRKAAADGDNPPYPRDLYPLQYAEDKNWLIEFKLATGGTLLIPCLEFFSRCYGRSEELKRVLTTYPWYGEKNAHQSRLYAPPNEPEELGKWKVKLRRRLVNSDVILLAHAKYDPYTERTAKSIYGQIESSHDPENKKPIFIKVAPWFQGPAQIKAKGIWFNDMASFLALHIVGCTDPIGLTIQRDRENTNKTNEGADIDGTGNAWAGAAERVLIKPPEIINLTSDNDPDHSAVSVEIQDPDFEVLGQPRVIIDVRRDKAKDAAGPRSKGTDASEFSSGEIHGSGKGVGYASIHARPIMESHGALRDMWNALLFLQKKYPDLIQFVDWFTFEDGFNSSGDPQLIWLQPFDEQNDVVGEIRNWLYLNPASQEPRGVLVARITVDSIPIYILEIQRRPRKKKDQVGNPKDSEESFKGLVFLLDDQNQLEVWLRKVLSEIRYVKGVMQKLAGTCPGKAATFNHAPASTEQVACEAAVLNALQKAGVT